MWESGPLDDAELDAEALRLNEGRPVDWDDEPWVTAKWLLQRYWKHHSIESIYTFPYPGDIQSEVSMRAALPSGVEVIGYFDHLLDGRILVERKTMRDWSRLDNLIIDPQVSLYFWLARENGYSIDGVLYDAIRTYRWKRDERPPNESFQTVWLDRTYWQIEQAVKWAESILNRRIDLMTGDAVPIRNLGPLCRSCSAQAQCHDDLAFPPEDGN